MTSQHESHAVILPFRTQAADPVDGLRAKLQAIEDEYTSLGHRLLQLDDDKAAIERRIREHQRAAKARRLKRG